MVRVAGAGGRAGGSSAYSSWIREVISILEAEGIIGPGFLCTSITYCGEWMQCMRSSERKAQLKNDKKCD